MLACLLVATPTLRTGGLVMQLSGGSLRTWGYDTFVDQAQIVLGTNGRPMDAGVELWSGPDNTAVSMRVYGEDGQLRPIRGSIGLGGRGHSSSVAVRNTGPLCSSSPSKERPLGPSTK